MPSDVSPAVRPPRLLIQFRAGHAPGDDAPTPLRPLFTTLPSRELQRLQKLAADRDPTYREPPLHTWYAAAVPERPALRDLARKLGAMSGVHQVALEPLPARPPSTPTDPLFPNQTHLDPAPVGVDAQAAWAAPGGRGTGIALVIVERAWRLTGDAVDHPDLPSGLLKDPLGHTCTNVTEIEHGMNTLGVITAVPNTTGVIGLASECGPVRLVTEHVADCADEDRYDAFARAIAVLEAHTAATLTLGHVLLLESQITLQRMFVTDYPAYADTQGEQDTWDALPPDGPGALAPVEADAALFQLIRLATALGIVVVEAAGNEGIDLAAARTNTLDMGGNPNGAPVGTEDSGAIMVSAAHAGNTTGLFWNRGTRVDCFAPGDGIWTTSDPLEPAIAPSEYTGFFADTSAASAVIAGVALCTQGLHTQATGRRLGPRALRTLITTNGTPCDLTGAVGTVHGTTDTIGVMPDLAAVVAALGTVPDVYGRDHLGDTGDPHTGSASSSPDVFVLHSVLPAGAAQATFGEGGPEQDSIPDATVHVGGTNRVMVRARNRGDADAAGVTATVYFAEPATLVLPPYTLVGSTTFGTLPATDALMVAPAIDWDGSGTVAGQHYCFVSLLDHPQDPAPDPAIFADFAQFVDYVRNRNNVTWRNFNAVTVSPAAGALPGGLPPGFDNRRAWWTLPFDAVGALDREVAMGLEVLADLPDGARLALLVPDPLADGCGVRPGTFVRNPTCGRLLVPLPRVRRARLGTPRFARGSRHPLALVVHVPYAARRARRHTVAVRQTFEGAELGRITWRLPALRDER